MHRPQYSPSWPARAPGGVGDAAVDVDGTGGDADGAQDLASGLPPAEEGATAAAAAGALQ